jgi:hypothetical protein
MAGIRTPEPTGHRMAPVAACHACRTAAGGTPCAAGCTPCAAAGGTPCAAGCTPYVAAGGTPLQLAARLSQRGRPSCARTAATGGAARPPVSQALNRRPAYLRVERLALRLGVVQHLAGRGRRAAGWGLAARAQGCARAWQRLVQGSVNPNPQAQGCARAWQRLVQRSVNPNPQARGCARAWKRLVQGSGEPQSPGPGLRARLAATSPGLR